MSDDEESDGLEGLLLAAKTGDVATFKQLLKAGEDVLQKDKNDQTVLHWAARSGEVPVICAGVSQGLTWHINATSKRGLTPLHDACLAGHVKATNLLLALGADVTAQTKEGYTPLLCAAGNGHVEVAKLLVGAGCDPNKLIPPIGVNAVHIATWTGQADVLDTLLQLGARADEKSKIGKTAAEFAAEQENTECIEILKKHVAKGASSQIDEMKMFKSKMRRVEEKIRGYFEEKLKEEISYFEKQLQDQHEEDMSAIIKLQQEVSRLQSILGREQAQLLRGQPLRSPRPDIIDLNRIPTAPRPAGISRQKRLSDSDAPDNNNKSLSGGSPGTDSPESGNEDDRPGIKRVSSSKDKTISALIQESAKKTNSMAYLRRQSSEESSSRTPIPRSGSAGAMGLPNRPLSARRGRVITIDTPPTSPIIKTQPGGVFSDLSASTSAMMPMPPSPDRDHLQVSEIDAPKGRRKSLTMLLRPIFFGDGTNKMDKSRRRSVVATMPVSPPQDSKLQKKNKGPSLLQRPLPGIHAVADETEMNTLDE
ncbi:ankyrin repeat, PH and SEC7 domain containing protein secG-like [Patiria miniata]|uniref:Uncharacterized protein n=1 Tax=Patiria miniata TaxID=46514 RepID=A0A913ZBX7_PATMI|nr:ankyrin repeat, PH and SEC7 domain containing protein secG-like [Patiria miniata]